MASITQTVPYYIQGISEQPDHLKKKGQVRDAVNIVPDITDGLVKRPGAQFINQLSGINKGFSNANIDMLVEGAWFSIDQYDKYIGRVHTDGTVQIWKASNGQEQIVKYSANTLYKRTADTSPDCGCSAKYLAHSDPESIQFLTINDHTFVVNREKVTAMIARNDCRIENSFIHDSTGWPIYSDPNYLNPHRAYIELTDIAHKQQYPLNILSALGGGGGSYTRATEIEAVWVENSAGTPRPFATGSPGLPGIFGFPVTGRGMSVSGNKVTRYTYAETFDINPDPFSVGAGPHPNTTISQRNLRFRLEMEGMPYTQGQNTYADYRLEWKLYHGGYGWKTGDWFVVDMGDADGKGYYKITIKKHENITYPNIVGTFPIRPMPTSGEPNVAVNADSILDQMKTIIMTNTQGQLVVTKIGNGLLLEWESGDTTCRRGTSPFNITTTEPQVMNIVTSEISDVTKLPMQCKDGYIVKVVNSPEDEDDHWLKFVADNGTKGKGHWEETYEPCLDIFLDPCTMPHKIVRTAVGAGGAADTFDLQLIPWEDRKVGDDVTNPEPSFVGQTINNIAFFRNRLAFLSQENVVLSQAGDYYNLWVTSATTVADGDVIDIATSSTRPTVLYDSVETSEGLVVFSPYEQFMVTTEEASFTPTSARLHYISTYDYNIGIKPLNLGTSIGFTSNSGLSSRFWQLANPSRNGSPTVVEQSKPIAGSLPTNLLTAADSRDNNIVLFTGWDPTSTNYGDCLDPYDTIWGYKYYSDGQDLIQSAWFKWNFYGKVIWHTIMANTYYAIISHNGVKVDLVALDLERQDATNILEDSNVCKNYLIHLDNAVTIKAGTYNSATGYTTFVFEDPAGNLLESHKKQPSTANGGHQVIYCKAGTMKGNAVQTPTFTANSQSSFAVKGDWSGSGTYNASTGLYPTGNTCLIGFNYNMQVEFPSVYVTKPTGDSEVADLTANLNIHRSTFDFGPTGYFSTILERKGRTDYIQNYEASSNYTFKYNQYNITLNSTETVPIYSDNKDYKLKISSIHHTPCTLYSQTWEGDYNSNYYQRA